VRNDRSRWRACQSTPQPPPPHPYSRCSPDNCDKVLFERVLALRERRLDLDEAAADINKASDEARKAAERFTQREKTIDKELAAINNEAAAFQREKQSRLNTIDSVLVLRASQIVVGKQPPYFSPPSLPGAPPRWWDAATTPDGMLPASLQDTTLFTRTALKGLRAHIGVLSSEADALATTFAELHKDERRLIGETKRLQADIAKARTAAEELQILKFGRVIDQEALDRATSVSNAASAETSAAIMAAAVAQDAELAAIRKRTVEDQTRLLELTRQHTMLLEAVAALTGRLGALEASLSGKAEIAAETTALASALGATATAGVADFPAGSGLKAAMATRRTGTAAAALSSTAASALPLPDPLLAGVGEGGGLGASTHSLPAGATASATTVVKMGSINVAALNRSLTATSAAIARGIGGGGMGRRGGGGGGGDMGATLGGGSGVVVSDAGGGAGVGSRAEAAERERLLARVTSQAEEIAALRAAIAALRGGSGTGGPRGSDFVINDVSSPLSNVGGEIRLAGVVVARWWVQRRLLGRDRSPRSRIVVSRSVDCLFSITFLHAVH
jgi:hypothetical protein